MNINIIKQQAGRILSENATTILTGAGVVGVVATAVLTHRAALKSEILITAAEREETMKADRPVSYSTMEKAKIVWPQYIPAVVVGGTTIASIIMANRMSVNKAAALAAAYGISENRLREYKEKMADRLTGPKNQGITDEIAQDHVTQNPLKENTLVIIDGDVLFYDMFTGRYFRSTMDKVRHAEAELNQELFATQYASLSEFYDRIGLPPTQFSDIIGWNTIGGDGPLKIEYSTTLTQDGKPCIAINFSHIPKPDAHKLY